MNTKSNENAVEQHAVPSDIFRTPEAQRLVAEIRSQLPGLATLNGAFAKLHEFLDEHDMTGNFETDCEKKFGVNPELLIEATERLSSAASNHLEQNNLN